MSTLTASRSEIEIPVLAEAARAAREAYNRVAAGNSARDREAVQIEAALARLNATEGALIAARLEEDRQNAERDRQQRLQAIDEQLTAKTAEIEALQQQQRELPDRIACVRGAHVRLQVERAAIAG